MCIFFSKDALKRKNPYLYHLYNLNIINLYNLYLYKCLYYKCRIESEEVSRKTKSAF